MSNGDKFDFDEFDTLPARIDLRDLRFVSLVRFVFQEKKHIDVLIIFLEMI